MSETTIIEGKEYKVQSFTARKYSSIDMIRFVSVGYDFKGNSTIEHLREYNDLFPEPTDRQKLKNLLSAIGFNEE